MMEPTIRYVNSTDGVRIAYSTLGSGPVLLVMPVLPGGHLELEWLMPERRDWYLRMAEHHTIVRYDPRGAGLSSRGAKDLTFDAHYRDLEAIVEQLGCDSMSILARHLAGPIAIKYTALHPKVISRLLLWHAFAKAADYATVARTEVLQSLVQRDWELYTESVATFTVAAPDHEMNRRHAAYIRGSIEPEQYGRSLECLNRADCSEFLPHIPTPTLVLQRRDVRKFDPAVSRTLASEIPNARLELVEGSSWALLAEDVDHITEIVQSFLSEDFLSNGETCDFELAPCIDFTERERQVLQLLTRGMKNRGIAERLCVSVHTVDRHIANIYLKLGVHNRVEAATYALRHGLA